jgi:Prokaryotic E2 family E
MEERIRAEIALLKNAFPTLEIREDLWCRFADYALPAGIWNVSSVELAFQVPAQIPGAQPYSFWVRPGMRLATGQVPTNYSENVTIPFGEGWGQFSWSPEVWTPAANVSDIAKGSNMFNFVTSFATRLRDAS